MALRLLQTTRNTVVYRPLIPVITRGLKTHISKRQAKAISERENETRERLANLELQVKELAEDYANSLKSLQEQCSFIKDQHSSSPSQQECQTPPSPSTSHESEEPADECFKEQLQQELDSLSKYAWVRASLFSLIDTC